MITEQKRGRGRPRKDVIPTMPELDGEVLISPEVGNLTPFSEMDTFAAPDGPSSARPRKHYVAPELTGEGTVIAVQVPFGPPRDPAAFQGSTDTLATRLSRDQANKLARIMDGLNAAGITVGRARRLDKPADILAWLADQIPG